jgi:hypothetical protein
MLQHDPHANLILFVLFGSCCVRFPPARAYARAPALLVPSTRLRARLILLLAEQRIEADTGDLDDLKAAARNISLCLTRATESGHEDLIVLVDEVERAIVRHERGHLLAVLDQLDAARLTNGGVRLDKRQATSHSIRQHRAERWKRIRVV